MAETIDYETREYEYAIHHISCDKCGKHICDSTEYDDGYYDDPSEYEQKIYVGGWYKLEAHLCDECKSKTTTELIKLLEDFGFEKERY